MATRVESWYDANVDFENHRLEDGRLGFAITLHTLLDLLGTLSKTLTGKLSIIDIGCGTGRYFHQSI
jgi:S-adenosylmethionine-dependent methyltransferase